MHPPARRTGREPASPVRFEEQPPAMRYGATESAGGCLEEEGKRLPFTIAASRPPTGVLPSLLRSSRWHEVRQVASRAEIGDGA
jgi:hypothetical protein